MRTKQKSVRVFEITTDNYDKVVGLIESKYILLRKYLLLIKTNNEKIKEYFNSKDLEVRFVKKEFNGSNEKLEIEEIKDNLKKEEDLDTINKESSTKTKIYDKIIRSGRDIKENCKLVFLEKINNGAKVYSSKEIEIFDEVNGQVVCDGDYMIVKKAKKGSIIFKNQPLEEIKTLSYISVNGIKEIE